MTNLKSWKELQQIIYTKERGRERETEREREYVCLSEI